MIFSPTLSVDADLAKALGDFQLPPDLAKMFDQPKNQGPR